MCKPFDDDLSFSEGIEDLAIEQLVTQARVEALDVAVLPGLPRSTEAVLAPTAVIQAWTASATHSGPLSDRT
jgi:hypothetical protein